MVNWLFFFPQIALCFTVSETSLTSGEITSCFTQRKVNKWFTKIPSRWNSPNSELYYWKKREYSKFLEMHGVFFLFFLIFYLFIYLQYVYSKEWSSLMDLLGFFFVLFFLRERTYMHSVYRCSDFNVLKLWRSDLYLVFFYLFLSWHCVHLVVLRALTMLTFSR